MFDPVKKSYLREPLVEEMEPHMHDHVDSDEELDTLSFCEFSINSDADTWEDCSRESSLKSSAGGDDDHFEFFNSTSGENLSSGKTTFSYTPPENIIFFGKLISYKEQPISQNPKRTFQNTKQKRQKKARYFRWRWNLASSIKTIRSSRKNNASAESTGTAEKAGSYKILSAAPKTKISERGHNEKNEKMIRRRKPNKEHDFSVHNKVSYLTSTLGSKSKWFLFLFGSTKYRARMELRDIKNRQSRHRRSSSLSKFRLKNDQSNNDDHSRLACIERSKGYLWAVVRALSCGGGGGDPRSTAVVESSTVSVLAAPVVV